MSRTKKEKSPAHLQPATRRWWETVNEQWQLEDHHRRLLTLAAEAWDRATEARRAIAEHGLTYEDRFGAPRSRPEIAVERDSRLAFARMLRELDLDQAGDPDRPPRIKGVR
jgi:phage terminase small subunit